MRRWDFIMNDQRYMESVRYTIALEIWDRVTPESKEREDADRS